MIALPRGTRRRLGPWEQTPNTEASWEPCPRGARLGGWEVHRRGPGLALSVRLQGDPVSWDSSDRRHLPLLWRPCSRLGQACVSADGQWGGRRGQGERQGHCSEVARLWPRRVCTGAGPEEGRGPSGRAV